MEESVAANYDLAKEVKEFQETRAGVKGLIDDSGTLLKIPGMFIHNPQDLPKSSSGFGFNNYLKVPMIDLHDLEFGQWKEIVDTIREASETWDFFQIINHGIPTKAMDELLESQKIFHEEPKEVKTELYSYDSGRKIRLYSNQMVDETRPTNWRDTLKCNFPDDALKPESMQLHFRKEVVEYMKSMLKMRDNLSSYCLRLQD